MTAATICIAASSRVIAGSVRFGSIAEDCPPRAGETRAAPIMSAMLFPKRILLAAVCLASGCAATSQAPVARPAEGSITPHSLARTWDAEHVSPQAPPLMTHEEITGRLKAVAAGNGGMFS